MTDSVGRQLAACGTVTELLAAEATHGRADRFIPVEHLAADVLAASFAGKPPAKVGVTGTTMTLQLQHVPASDMLTVREMFDLAGQQAKGAWWLPESAPLKAGPVNLPAYMVTAPRWAMSSATADAGRVTFAGCPDALTCWALLVPLSQALCQPLVLRGPESGAMSVTERDAAWNSVDTTYQDLGLTSEEIATAVRRMRPGHGWSRLTSGEQLEVKTSLVTGLATAVGPATVARWRATQLRPLLDRYYAKARRNQPTMHTVLTKALQPTVAAFFGGDWLALLDYLGEQPAPGEQIATTLPEPRLYVQASTRVSQVAAEKNLPVDEVARMLASYLGTDGLTSPVEQRVEVLRGCWEVVDTAHAAQRPGMRSLAGLVGQGWLEEGEREPFRASVYERLLPARLLYDIDELWGGQCLPRYPDRIVSSLYPHNQMAAAFGPALSFWHDIAVTAWYICEGPYARTDLAGMAEHYTKQLAALAAAGTPADPALFADLMRAEQRLGRPQEIRTHRDSHEVAPGLTVEISISAGSRRDGFEILRDIITEHRRVWAAQHLETALRRAWEEPLRAVASELNRTIAGRGKLPTVKQFAGIVADAANGWFGGDLTALYVAIGEKPPVAQERVRLMPYDRVALGNRLFVALGGRHVPSPEAGNGYADSWALRRVVMEAPRYIQLEEALGRQPTAQEFRAQNHNWPAGVTYDDYAEAATRVRQELPLRRPEPIASDAAGRTSPAPPQPLAGPPEPPSSTPGAQTAAPPYQRPGERRGVLRRFLGR